MSKLFEADKAFFEVLVIPDEPRRVGAADKLCFVNSMEQFLASGRKEDAFVVYFCFSEIFHVFGEGYENTKKLLETLSDHEYHCGELLAKHRDHYSHSVYVFALGLAIYGHSARFRQVFKQFYGIDDDVAAAYKFFEMWGKSSLFHDIGYPFQLAFEQIENYGNEIMGKKNPDSPHVTFGNLDNFLAIAPAAAKRIREGLNVERDFATVNELFAYGVSLRDGYDEDILRKTLDDRLRGGGEFVDHGYFSAAVLARLSFAMPSLPLDIYWLDVLTAILMHNSLNKYDLPKIISNAHKISIKEHPMLYLLMLCDELQNWDRLAYGKVSKYDPIGWDFDISIENEVIEANYVFDSAILKDSNGTRKNKSLQAIEDGKFVRDIFDIVEREGALDLVATASVHKKEKKTALYASDDSFINLYDFAIAIHASYKKMDSSATPKQMQEEFGTLDLEYKVDNIELAKSYARKLELINCFYSSKDLDYPIVEDFRDVEFNEKGEDKFGYLCRDEHVRWVKDKIRNGWKYGVEGVDYFTTEERNRKKLHKCLVPNEVLSQEDRDKDANVIAEIIPKLRQCGDRNIKIYYYKSGSRATLNVLAIGQKYPPLTEGELAEAKERIKQTLLEYQKEDRVVVLTSMEYGAPQLIAECALELGIDVKASIPTNYERFVTCAREDALSNGVNYTADDESRLRLLLAQTVVMKDFSKYGGKEAATEYLINKCDAILALSKNGMLDDESKNILRSAAKLGKKLSDVEIL